MVVRTGERTELGRISELMRHTARFTMADVLAFRMRQRPVRMAAAISTLAVSSPVALALGSKPLAIGEREWIETRHVAGERGGHEGGCLIRNPVDGADPADAARLHGRVAWEAAPRPDVLDEMADPGRVPEPGDEERSADSEARSPHPVSPARPMAAAATTTA